MGCFPFACKSYARDLSDLPLRGVHTAQIHELSTFICFFRVCINCLEH